MDWKFIITTGEMFTPEGKLLVAGYAGGNLGKNPEGINNPAMCSIHDIGPLPMGIYTFGQLFNPHPRVGAYAFELLPDVGNDMYGRSGFFCHGDTKTPRCASEGCIVLPRWAREAMYSSQIRTLIVTA